MTDDTQASARPLLASKRHTLILMTILLAIAAVGFFQIYLAAGGPGAGLPTNKLSIYVSLLVAEWGLFAYVWFGLRRGGTKLSNLISERGWSLGSLVTDVVLGVALLAAWFGIDYASDKIFGSTPNQAAQALQVINPAQIPVWIMLSMSAGFVEELTFRGYLQKQYGVLLRSPLVGLVAQAILFGVSHGYQGVRPMISITVFGLLFGAVAMIRKSLFPGMVAHSLVDIIGGLAH